MSLSITKLEELLLSQGLTPTEYYTIDGEIAYVQSISKLGDNILIYINSKYPISVNKEIKGVVAHSKFYDIIELEIDDKGTLIENVINSYQQDVNDNNELYNKSTGFSPENKGANIEEQLEDNYKQDIKFESKIAPIEWTQLYLQLRRLMNIVKNIKYKIGLVTNKLVFSVKSDNSINTFKFKVAPTIQDYSRIMVTLDIETLYNNLDTVTNDIRIVQNSIITTMLDNHRKNNELLTKVINKMKDIPSTSLVSEFIEKSKHYLNNYDEMLQNLLQAEKTAEQKINTNYTSEINGIKGFHEDIQGAQRNQKSIETLEKIKELQRDIIDEIQNIRSKQERVLLGLDDLYYSNTIMSNTMIANIEKIKQL